MNKIQTNLPFHPNTRINYLDEGVEIRVSLNVSHKLTLDTSITRSKKMKIVKSSKYTMVIKSRVLRYTEAHREVIISTQKNLLREVMITCRELKIAHQEYEISQLKLF